MKLALVGLAVLLAGCGQKAAAPVTEAGGGGSTPAAAVGKAAEGGEAAAPAGNFEKSAAQLTQALRRFSAENRRVPTSLEEVVAAGYLPEMPAAPAGKKWSFDDQLRVLLKGK